MKYRHTEEAKNKIRLANIGRKHTSETKQKLSLIRKGQHHTKESKLKISNTLKGRPLSTENKRKIGLANKGKKKPIGFGEKVSLFRKGKPSSFKGKHHTEESRRRFSLSHGGTGISHEFEEYPFEFDLIRPTILKRDNHTCQFCFKFGNHVHHKDHDKNNNEPSNLLTLCCSCNSKEVNVWTKNKKVNHVNINN